MRERNNHDHNLDTDTYHLLARLPVPGAGAPDLMRERTQP
jgi:hypothetical protein